MITNGGRRENLHRNNLAEWVIYGALYPVYLIHRLFTFASSRLRG